MGVRDCMIGQDGIEIVPLLQRGASILARTNHVWARCCPGLLPVEMEAIVYWACVAAPRCLKLLDELILLRDVAMHRRWGATGQPRMSDAENMLSYMKKWLPTSTCPIGISPRTPPCPMAAHLP